MNYQNGRIYQILNHINDDIYVGSTTQSLSKRFSWHKGDSTKEKKQNYKLYRAMKEIGSENFYIELIENYPCNTKEELIAREQYYIRERGTLNSLIPGRNLAEYKIECRDQILQNKRLSIFSLISRKFGFLSATHFPDNFSFLVTLSAFPTISAFLSAQIQRDVSLFLFVSK